LDGLLAASRPTLSDWALDTPYKDLGRADTDEASRRPIFVTARFRSGSTLLWNVFRHVPECRAFYEPLNERRWFDPSSRGNQVDGTHRGVSDYWREYEGLTYLARWYRERWIDRDLYMDERHWDPDLVSYIHALIRAAPGRAVLQFNRVDFRLAWLRRQFPDATLIHLYRHPRDQWCSTLVRPSTVKADITIAEFEAHDHFYLLSWARDLRHYFPFLDPTESDHPYDIFYMIWRLSWIFGQRYCHASFSYEDLCSNPASELQRLLAAAGLDSADPDCLRQLISPAPKSKWHEYAPHEWFAQREARCEAILRRELAARDTIAPLDRASLNDVHQLSSSVR
jgi:hypothetical protein